MTQEIDQYLEKFPEEIKLLFQELRELVFSIGEASVEEKLWAKLPSYYCGERFIRIIPFKDHINLEAAGLAKHRDEFVGCKFTPKGMLQLKVRQGVPAEQLKAAFYDTFFE